jgi:hypothetical protein
VIVVGLHDASTIEMTRDITIDPMVCGKFESENEWLTLGFD